MKIPKFVKVIAVFLVVVVFFRAVNQAGPVSLDDVLVEIERFDWSLNSVKEFLSYFEKGSFSSQLKSWDASLSLFDNLGNVVGSFCMAVGNMFFGIFEASGHMLRDLIGLFVQVLNILCSILGFDLHIEWNPSWPDGYRGGR